MTEACAESVGNLTGDVDPAGKVWAHVESASLEAVAGLEAKLEAASHMLPPLDCRWLASEEIAQAYNKIILRTKHNWQSGRKRGLHQLQVESIGAAVLAMLRQDASGGERVVVELGAGKAMLGSCVAEASGATVVSVERRTCRGEDCDEVVEHPVIRWQEDVRDASLRAIVSSLHPDSSSSRRIFVCAKHLCAGATCAALRLIAQAVHDSVDVRGCIVAPCCHPQLVWETFCNTPALEVLGFNAQDFSLLLGVLLLSKDNNVSSCKYRKWGSLTGLGRDKIVRLGGIARRVIEEARRQFLVSLGFDVAVVEYVPRSLTPDNLILVATLPAQSWTSQEACPALPLCTSFSLPCSGVLLHAGGHLTSVSRLLEYLLELRAEDLQANGHSAMEWVFPLQADIDCSQGLVSSIVVGGPLLALLPILCRNPILARSCDQFLPFDRHVDTLQSLRDTLPSGLFTTHADCKLRVACYPRHLEKSLIAALPGERLGPAVFSHSVSLIRWPSANWGKHDALAFSVVSRELWDPREWRERLKGDSVGSTPVHRSLVQHLNESLERLGNVVQVAGRAVLVVSDAAPQLESMLAWCIKNGSREMISIQCRRTADLQWQFAVKQRLASRSDNEDGTTEVEWRSHDLGTSLGEAALSRQMKGLDTTITDIRTVLWRYDRGLADAALMLGCLPRALGLERCVAFVGQVKLGRHGRARNVNKHVASLCLEQGLSVAVHHLMSDGELERTLRLSASI